MPRLPMIAGSLKPVSTTIGASPPVIRKPKVGTSWRRPGSCARTRKLVSSSMSPRSRTCTSRPISPPSRGCGAHPGAGEAPAPSHVRSRWSGEQPALAREVHRLGARARAELAEEVAPVRLGRRFRDAERERHLLEAQTLVEHPQELELTARQVRAVVGG